MLRSNFWVAVMSPCGPTPQEELALNWRGSRDTQVTPGVRLQVSDLVPLRVDSQMRSGSYGESAYGMAKSMLTARRPPIPNSQFGASETQNSAQCDT